MVGQHSSSFIRWFEHEKLSRKKYITILPNESYPASAWPEFNGILCANVPLGNYTQALLIQPNP